MNIWVIGRSYPQKNNQMQGSFELEQARLLAQKGHKVTYIAVVFHPFKKIKKWGYCQWKEDDLTVCIVSHFYAPERMNLYLKQFQRRKWEEHLKRVESTEGEPDVIHVHYPALITESEAVLAYQKKGVAIALTEHWSKTLSGKLNIKESSQLTSYLTYADACICVGSGLKKAMEKIGQAKRPIEIVPNMVDCDLFKLPPKRQEGTFNFIVVGRLIPEKQCDQIIQAFTEAFGGNKEVSLTIVGDGKEKKKLQKLTNKLGVLSQISFTGTLERREVVAQIAASQVLVSFSKAETFGVTVIEAWACGKPVIASDGIGFLEYWEEDLGFVVPYDNRTKLAHTMKKVYEQYDRYEAEQIHLYAKMNFSEETIYKKLEKIYLEVTQ